MSQKNKAQLFIGSDNFDAFMGLVLKKLGKVDEVILYTIDYVPQRFSNPILNYLYHFFDRQCLRNCKIIWNVSPVMADARESLSGILKETAAPQILVPLGMWHKRIPKLPQSNRIKSRIVFMGHVLEKQGIDVVIKAMPKILKKIPSANLLIIGTGQYEEKLKSLVKTLKLQDRVTFTGFIQSHKEVEEMLSKSVISVAMYKPDPSSFTNWADPGKLKNYLSAGLPIILTDVPPVAKDLAREKCGVITPYNDQKVAEKIIGFLNNQKKLKEYSDNAIKFARRFDWDLVFKSALSKSL